MGITVSGECYYGVCVFCCVVSLCCNGVVLLCINIFLFLNRVRLFFGVNLTWCHIRLVEEIPLLVLLHMLALWRATRASSHRTMYVALSCGSNVGGVVGIAG